MKESRVSLLLKDVYGTVSDKPVYIMPGLLEGDLAAEYVAEKSFSGQNGPALFVRGDEIYKHLERSGVKEGYVTIVVSGLPNIYSRNKEMLSQKDSVNLELAVLRPLASFKNIFKYDAIRPFAENASMSLYQLFGDVTPFNIVYIPVADYKYFVENSVPVTVRLNAIDQIICFV